MLSLLLASLLIPGGTAPAPPSTAGTQVVLQDRMILLPALPWTVDAARAGFKETRARTSSAIRDLDRAILDLEASLPPGAALPASLKLPPEGAREARVLAGILNDATGTELEKAAAGLWDQWIGTLVDKGVEASPEAPKGKAREGLPDREREEARRRLARMKGSYDRDQKDPITRALWDGERDLERGGDRAPSAFGSSPRQERMAYDHRVEATARHAGVAREMAPRLSGAWDPLVAHLTATAKTLADLDRGPEAPRNPGLESLRVHAKLRFMRRFRSALWFCDRVWAQMASEEVLPAPR